jgi:hypothetical protein
MSDGTAAAAAASQARRHAKAVLSVGELPAARLVAARAEAFGGARNRCADRMGTHHWHCSRVALTAHGQHTKLGWSERVRYNFAVAPAITSDVHASCERHALSS